MKVCFVVSTYPPGVIGGQGEVVYNLQKCLPTYGVDVEVFTTGETDPKYPHTIRVKGGKRLFPLGSIPYYARHIRKAGFDVMNIHAESGMGLVPFLLFKNDCTRVVTTLHTSYVEEARAVRKLLVHGTTAATPTLNEYVTKYILTPVKWLGTYLDCSISDRIIAVCERTKTDCARDYGIPQDSIRVIRSGVDLAKFNPKVRGDGIRQKYKLRERRLILCVGCGTILKGVPFLLHAMTEVRNRIPNVALIVVGPTPYLKQMLSMAERLGIEDRVIFAGKVLAELPQYYAASDVVVLSSLHEGLPLVALESMASGKPVVASSVGGIPEVVADRENGLLSEAGNVTQLAESIIFLLENESLRREMGQAGRSLAEKNHDWSLIARTYLHEFENLP